MSVCKRTGIAEALGVGVDRLAAALKESRGESAGVADRTAPAPLTVESLHAQARAHVSLYGPKRVEIWVVGAANLTVMRRIELLDGRWKENLLWGLNYTILWALDLVDEARFGTVLLTLAELEKRAARDYEKWSESVLQGPRDARPDWLEDVIKERKGPGRINHVGVSVLERPSRAAIDLYTKLGESAARERFPRGRVRPYAEAHLHSSGVVGVAARRMLRSWHPETGIVVYRPTDGLAPAAANVRLMPVAGEIVTRLAPEIEETGVWYWLTPTGARRIVNAIGDLEAALGADAR